MNDRSGTHAVDDATIGRIVRTQQGRCIATLTRHLGDIGDAEDAFQEAVEIALDRWPRDGLPDAPGAWLTTVARRRGLDRRRRAVRGSSLLGALASDPTSPVDLEPVGEDPADAIAEKVGPVDDDQLRLLFACCHPVLPSEAQVALTLRLFGGLTTAEIARAFIVRESTMGQRLVRAKRTLRDEQVLDGMPEDHELPDRLAAVLAVIYLVHTTGTDASPDDVDAAGLRAEAVRLARLVVELAPDEEEAVGLLALLLLAEARWPARHDADGAFVPLRSQDRRSWDRRLVADGHRLVRWCLRRDRPGPYQWQAAIAAVHTDAGSAAATDWDQVLALYDQWLAAAPTPVVALNRASALAETRGPATALPVVEALADRLEGYQPFHAVRADLRRRTGDLEGAGVDYRRATDLAPDPAVAAYLRRMARTRV